MKKKIIMLLSIVTLYSSIKTKEIESVTIVPIADLVGESLQSLHKTDRSLVHYEQLPLCGKKGTYACPRLHQTLFNEKVTILEEKGEEVRVKIPTVFFEQCDNTKKQDTYWSLKKNFLPLDQLSMRQQKMIPEPIDYTKNNIEQTSRTLTLLMPFYDKKTHYTFSVGTRFVLVEKQSSKKSHLVAFFNPKTRRIQKLKLPHQYGLCNITSLKPHEKITLFTSLMKRWIYNNNGFIPYVWGGCSLANFTTTPQFEVHEQNDARGNIAFYLYPEHIKLKKPKNGFDCTGLISRAAQICAIPYYFKNTTTLGRYLEPIKGGETLHNGDLILFAGHVMVISNVKKNLIIEARAYNHGFGRVHELPLNQVFAGMNSFTDLKKTYLEKKSLERLNVKGKVVQNIPRFTLLSLASAWNYQPSTNKKL